MTYAHVIDVKTGLERKNVTVKAYELIKKRYTLLGYVDENGNPVAGPEVPAKAGNKKKESVAPVVNRSKMTDEEKAAKMAELKAMNEAAIKKVTDEQAAKEAERVLVKNVEPDSFNGVHEVKERQKPGPKPKQS